MKTTSISLFFSLFIIGFLLPCLTANAQNSDSLNLPNLKQPKIGVVLSGGGALGLAHIGVLKVLEERGIKPDFIVGTSMGSVVGGLYALGYTASEIEILTKTMNWDAILSSTIPLTYVAYEEKQDYSRYTITFPIKNGKPTLPTGLIEGQLLLEKLTEFVWSGINYKSFDDLPIPFRCVATDVSTGQEVIFDKGSIALAMRASMAIPTIFTAVNMDSTLMVDGGVVNNFPVDIARKMGADYIIGSDVTSGIKQAYEIENMAGILYQIAMYPSLWKLQENIDNTDLYIHPDVSEFSASDFTKAEAIIKTGEIAAKKQLAEMDSLCTAIGYLPKEIKNNVAAYPDSIYLTGINYNTEDQLHLAQINDHLECTPGTHLEIKQYKHDIRLLYGTLKYKSISYWAKPDSTNEGSYKLDIHFDKNPKSDIRIGVHYDNVFSVGIVTNFTTRDFLIKNTRTKIKLDISPNFKGEIEWLKYFGKKKRFNFLMDYSFFVLNTPVYENGSLNQFTQSNSHQFTAKFQTNFELNSKFATGYYFYNNNNHSTVGNKALKDVKVISSYHIGFAEFKLNTLNKTYHPTWGSKLSIRGDVVFNSHYKAKFPNGVTTINIGDALDSILITEAELNSLLKNVFTPVDIYGNLILSYKQIFSISKNIKFITNLNTALTLTKNDESRFYRFFNSGGNVQLFYFDYQMYGLNYAESQTNNVAILKTDFQISPIKNLFIYVGANYALFKDNGISKKAPTTGSYVDSELFGYGLNIAYTTPLGPVELGASLNDNDPNVRWNFQIGFQF